MSEEIRSCSRLFRSGKHKNIQSRNLKFVFTASFQACEKIEILKYKIDHEIIILISFYYTIHYAVPIYEHFPLKKTIFKHKRLV